MREIGEDKLHEITMAINAVIEQAITNGALPPEIVYAALTAISDTVDDGSLEFAGFVTDAWSEVVFHRDTKMKAH